jgi:hypothetical protein
MIATPTALIREAEINANVTPAADALLAAGAVALVNAEPRPILIGHLEWLNDGELLIFTAFGEAPTDAHLVHFDDVIVHETGSMTFVRDGTVTGAIQPIDDADLDDPDDYRIAWQFWQDVAPLHRPRIEQCCAAALDRLAGL